MEQIADFFGMTSITIPNIYRTLYRKKSMEDSSESKLAKVLSAFDLTALGIGSTLGVGVYVLAGEVSKLYAGPAVIISFLIAAIASVFAGLCYAEFGARVPKAGSAYIYSYVTIGEFIAFIIGWNLILEYAIGSASVVKAVSTHIDPLMGNAMKNFLQTYLPMNIEGLSPYPDLFAFTVTMVFTWAIALGAKESSRVNNAFTMMNLGVVLFVVIAGLFKVSARNWALPKEEVPPNFGDGGFMPYGISGIIKGAAVCFYGFIGFDCIATAGEEAKNPKKSIPFAVITSLALIFLAYFGVSTVLTMMLPYYEQDQHAPLTYVFRMYGWNVAEYIVTVGAICGLGCSLMGAMFPLPRIVFAMASDGLLFKFMGVVSEKYKTPFNGTVLTGFLIGFLSAIFELNQLVNMMSMGTLLAYSMVASCVLILRYESDEKRETKNIGIGRRLVDPNDTNCGLIKKLFNTSVSVVATAKTAQIVSTMTLIFAILCFAFSQFLIQVTEYTDNLNLYLPLLILTGALLVVDLYIISRQPLSGSILSFKVPFVPWLPGLSILINIYLMIKLDVLTWIRFAVWMAIGLTVYFTYSIRNSRLRQRNVSDISVSDAADSVCTDTPLMMQTASC